jgi:hypothetical protein
MSNLPPHRGASRLDRDGWQVVSFVVRQIGRWVNKELDSDIVNRSSLAKERDIFIR